LAVFAVFTTQLPAVQELNFDDKVSAAGRSQSPIVPTDHVTVLPDKTAEPLLGLPTNAALLKQFGRASVTVTFWVEMVETARFLNAVCPVFA
jgi:hypothetical protein